MLISMPKFNIALDFITVFFPSKYRINDFSRNFDKRDEIRKALTKNYDLYSIRFDIWVI